MRQALLALSATLFLAVGSTNYFSASAYAGEGCTNGQCETCNGHHGTGCRCGHCGLSGNRYSGGFLSRNGHGYGYGYGHGGYGHGIGHGRHGILGHHAPHGGGLAGLLHHGGLGGHGLFGHHGPRGGFPTPPPMMGPAGPPTPTYGYPYYTVRGPRDFLVDNPPSIGR